MIGTLLRLQNVDPGFRSDHVLSMFLNLPGAKYKPEQAIEFYNTLLQRLQNTPGIQSAAISSFVPFTNSGWGKYFSLEAHPPTSIAEVPLVQYRQVSPAIFQRSLGIRLIRGRYFEESDNPNHPHCSDRQRIAARRFFPNVSPIGQRVLAGVPESLIPPGWRRRTSNFRGSPLLASLPTPSKIISLGAPPIRSCTSHMPRAATKRLSGGRYLIMRVWRRSAGLHGSRSRTSRSLSIKSSARRSRNHGSVSCEIHLAAPLQYDVADRCSRCSLSFSPPLVCTE